MKRISFSVIGALFASAVFGDLADIVDPFVGTAGTGHTFPAACVPFGMVQAGADTGYGDWAHCSGYIYGDKTICGFTQTHLNGTGCPDLGDVRIMPLAKEGVGGKSEKVRIVSPFDKSSERAEPGYYAVTLKEPAMRVEIAASAHSAIYRFMPEAAGEIRLFVEPKALFFNPPEFPERPTRAQTFDVAKDENGVVGLSGSYRATCWVTRDVGYEVAFSRAASCENENVYAFDLKDGETLMVKVGLSAGGGAKANLAAEIPGWDFDAARNAARQKWNEALSVATIEGTSMYCVKGENEKSLEGSVS